MTLTSTRTILGGGRRRSHGGRRLQRDPPGDGRGARGRRRRRRAPGHPADLPELRARTTAAAAGRAGDARGRRGGGAAVAVHLDHAEDPELACRRRPRLRLGHVRRAKLTSTRTSPATRRVVACAHARGVLRRGRARRDRRQGRRPRARRAHRSRARRRVRAGHRRRRPRRRGRLVPRHDRARRRARPRLIARLHAAVPPLVLHGSSGVSDDTIVAASVGHDEDQRLDPPERRVHRCDPRRTSTQIRRPSTRENTSRPARRGRLRRPACCALFASSTPRKRDRDEPCGAPERRPRPARREPARSRSTRSSSVSRSPRRPPVATSTRSPSQQLLTRTRGGAMARLGRLRPADPLQERAAPASKQPSPGRRAPSSPRAAVIGLCGGHHQHRDRRACSRAATSWNPPPNPDSRSSPTRSTSPPSSRCARRSRPSSPAVSSTALLRAGRLVHRRGARQHHPRLSRSSA